MGASNEQGRELSRRGFLALGGAVTAAGGAAALLDPLTALAAPRWPSGRLDPRDAVRVREREFMPLRQFRRWHDALDRIGPAGQRGLRATGSVAHERYVDDLHDDLRRAGVRDLLVERVPMRRWTASRWSLELLDGGTPGPVRTASYIPYSGQTPAGGISAPLAYVEPGSRPAAGSLAGRIAVFDVPLTTLPLAGFLLLGYRDSVYDPAGDLSDPTAQYKRPYLNGVVPMLELLEAAGAAAVVGVLDYPQDAADGSYFPYDGEIRSVPGLYVDRAVGASLKQQARAGTSARLLLPAQVVKTSSRNLIGFIPGRSSELVALHCHTDGSNAIEDNGPAAIVAIAQYLARLPRAALPRTVMIVLTTGHFAGGNGSRAFLQRHRGDLVKRTNAALTIEHLGLREWLEQPSGRMGATGRWEPGVIFAPPSKALVEAAATAVRRGRMSPGGVLKPFNAAASGAPDDAAWPGEGQYLYARGRIQTANYITGPTYLLNWGISTSDKVDLARVRAQSIAFTEMILRLGRTSRARLLAADAS